MEHVELLLTDEAFDSLVHEGSLAQAGASLKVAVKLRATQAGKAAVVLAWDAVLPDGSVRRVQAVTTADLFLGAAKGVAAYLEGRS